MLSISPGKSQARQNFYEAARPTHERPRRTDRGSGDTVVGRAGDQLRIQGRHLEQNLDLATGILDTLVNKTIGRGILYEPQVLDTSGDLHMSFNEELLDWHERWSEFPEVTRTLSRSEMERLLARTWFRDGEVFKVYHQGRIPTLPHPTETALAIEALEPDHVPMHYNNHHERITQGVKKNAWGRPIVYYFYKEHPGHGYAPNLGLKTVNASMVGHVKLARRLHQTRGVSVFASVLNRLDDLKDFEESERIAARIAAKMVASIKRGSPDMFGLVSDENDNDYERQVYEKGMTFYDLMPGEEIEVIDSNRPNSGLDVFRSTQLKAAAAGSSTGYSSISKDYDGSYAARRMELVDQQVNYDVLLDYFIAHSAKPDYKRFVQLSILGGLKIPGDVDLRTLFDVECTGASQPWVDPLREKKAAVLDLDYGLSSESEQIRKTHRNPYRVKKQIQRDRKLNQLLGLEKQEPTK